MTGDRRPATGGDAAGMTPCVVPAAEGRPSPVARQRYSEDQLLPLSAVSQYVHCPRRGLTRPRRITTSVVHPVPSLEPRHVHR